MCPSRAGTIPALRLISLGLILAILAGCTPTTASIPPTSGSLDQAAAEATAIIARAQATAVVLEAQARATAIVQSAGTAKGGATPASQRASDTQPITLAAPPPRSSAQGEHEAAQNEMEEERDDLELLGVSLAAEGSYIMVSFRSSPKAAHDLWQGRVSVTDEETGRLYNEVPVMPVIGPLITRPKQQGQIGYVMLVNADPPVQPGSVVTVVLNEFRQEHVLVQ